MKIGRKVGEENNMCTYNPDRMNEFSVSLEFLQRATVGRDLEFSYEFGTLFKGMGCISIVASVLAFFDINAFLVVTAAADNFEVYPKIDGKIQINFMFFGLKI